MTPFRNESLQEWIPSKNNPFKNESLQKWIPSETIFYYIERIQAWRYSLLTMTGIFRRDKYWRDLFWQPNIPKSCPEAVLKYNLIRSFAFGIGTPSFSAKASFRWQIRASEGRLNSFCSFLSSTTIVTQNFVILIKSLAFNSDKSR